jgi:hypothetical protein
MDWAYCLLMNRMLAWAGLAALRCGFEAGEEKEIHTASTPCHLDGPSFNVKPVKRSANDGRSIYVGTSSQATVRGGLSACMGRLQDDTT